MARLPEFSVHTNICAAPHVVLLGAGASRASFPSGDAFGKKLPLMNELPETTGVAELIPKALIGKTFEETYDHIIENGDPCNIAHLIEQRIEEYFSGLKIPNSPTLYDYLILSLREKDIIATFNWDPFLAQAYYRNLEAADRRLPKIVFLHGNVAIGQCLEHQKKGFRFRNDPNWTCPQCGMYLQPTKLLYPVSNKNYSQDKFIASEWNELRAVLTNACLLTIFGYSAPKTDVAARKLINSAWNENDSSSISLVDIVDTADPSAIKENWREIECYRDPAVFSDIFDTALFNHPRRSCDATAMAMLQQNPQAENTFPKLETLSELHDWIKPLLDEEKNSRFWL